MGGGADRRGRQLSERWQYENGVFRFPSLKPRFSPLSQPVVVVGVYSLFVLFIGQEVASDEAVERA